MFNKAKNTKQQGDIGLGAAIAWFTMHAYTVCVPLTDSQDYDLVVDDGSGCQRVQVKTTSFARDGSYLVSLTIKGGNQSWNGVCKKFDASKVDLLFIVTSEGARYLIPCRELTAKSGIKLSKKYDKYKVGSVDGGPSDAL